VFESDREHFPEEEGIYRMRTDGSHVRLIVPASAAGAFAVATPMYSSDGGTIAFTAYRRPRDAKPGRRTSPARRAPSSSSAPTVTICAA
jgi:Tol biopolymer transport system component